MLMITVMIVMMKRTRKKERTRKRERTYRNETLSMCGGEKVYVDVSPIAYKTWLSTHLFHPIVCMVIILTTIKWLFIRVSHTSSLDNRRDNIITVAFLAFSLSSSSFSLDVIHSFFLSLSLSFPYGCERSRWRAHWRKIHTHTHTYLIRYSLMSLHTYLASVCIDVMEREEK